MRALFVLVVVLASARLREQGVRDFADHALPATAFFSIPGNRLIELGAQVEI